MFSKVSSFEEIISQETPETKEARKIFEVEKKQELKSLISKINKEIFLDILPIKAKYSF